MTDSNEKEGEPYDSLWSLAEKTTHGICCTIPEMATRWVMWASIGCHRGGGVLINHRRPYPNPRHLKTMEKTGENSRWFTQNESQTNAGLLRSRGKKQNYNNNSLRSRRLFSFSRRRDRTRNRPSGRAKERAWCEQKIGEKCGGDERERGEKAAPLPRPLLLIFLTCSQFRSLRVPFWKRLLCRLQ